MATATAIAATLVAAFLFYQLCRSLFFSPLARIPGPKSFAITRWRLAYEDYRGTRTRKIFELHKRYGPVVRVGPTEVSFNSTSALRAIYGAGSGFERTSFYHMFEAYGRKNMFSSVTVKEHGERKKMFAAAYAKSAMLRGDNAAMIENKVRQYLDLVDSDAQAGEIFSSLHYFSLDTITQFLYGDFGKTACLEGADQDRALVEDIVDKARRRLAWFAVHLPGYTEWLYSRVGIAGRVACRFYPMQLPTTYTGIRRHAMDACKAFAHAATATTGETKKERSLIARLWKHHCSERNGEGLDDADVASECADHLLAGIDTTSDTLMFLIWSISRTGNIQFQRNLIDEVRSMPQGSLNADGIPRVEANDKLVYVNAVIKETLRLFAPLPGSEPRSSPTATSIDGYFIPPATDVSISPYVLHRNSEVFPDPLRFNPDRWLDPSQNLAEMNRWFWAFSSGGRMCIGMQYALTP
jgi:cytochrome P450